MKRTAMDHGWTTIGRVTLMVMAGSIAIAGCSGGDASPDASKGGTSTVSSPVDPSGSDVASTVASTAGTPTSASTSSTSSSTSTTTTIPLFTEGAVVLVANAADLPGAAAGLTEQLAAAGFVTAAPTNAAGNEAILETSKVYFLPGGFDAASSIAAAMGAVQVAPMPTPAWIVGATAALGNANVLVMLGKDLAGQAIPALAGR